MHAELAGVDKSAPERTTKIPKSIAAGASSENNCIAVASNARMPNTQNHRVRESSSHLNKETAQSTTRRVLSVYGRAFSDF